MNLATLEVGVDEAKARLAEYTSALRSERNAEDEAIAAAYRAAARGLPVISLSAAVNAGGVFDNGLPHIAVCRATARQCRVSRDFSGVIVYSDAAATVHRSTALVGAHHVRVSTELRRANRWSGVTLVPPVPPRHRPKRLPRLAALHVLWEVERWELVPPTDPALIRHIRGDLWAVLATWDLTEIERHVLAQRAR